LTRYSKGTPANLQNLRETMGRFRSVNIPNLPPFTGGAVGYFGYDMVRTIEDIPSTGIDDCGTDDATLMFFKTILAFDHLRHQIHIISNLLADESSASLETQYELALSEISAIEATLIAPLDLREPPRKQNEPALRSNFEKQDYLKAVEKSKEYIAAGD